MSEIDEIDEEFTDEHYKILYTTFLVIAVIVFFWLLMAIFDNDHKKDLNILNMINKDNEDA
jgi:hypothetical protein